MSDNLLNNITKNLQESTDNNTFCTRFSFPATDFPVEIKHLGEINFPVSTRIAKEIIDQAQLAPFGWRDQTIVDTRVRNAWEIKKSKIKLPGTSMEQIPEMLERIKKNLNMAADATLVPELHNLVIYEKGQFFSSHQDTEKCKDMIATMVILLPSNFKGGTLTIDRQGDVKKYTAPRTTNHLQVIAFYTDCVHEVKKITSGYRIALTFNLLLKGAGTLQPLQNPALTESIKAYFSEDERQALNCAQSNHPTWLVYLLDHQYSQYGLSWGHLKSADRTHASQLLAAAEALDLEAHLSLADVHEVWQTESDYSNSGYYGYRGDDDDEEDEDISGDDVECIEFIEGDCELRRWVNSNGKKRAWKGHYVPDEMVGWTKAMDNFEPFDSAYEGFMGNYGDTMEKWYHRAAITLWRKTDAFPSLFAIDANGTQKKVQKMLDTNFEQGVAALKTLLPQWERKIGSDGVQISETLKLCLLVRDKALATQLLEGYGMEAVCRKHGVGLRNLARSYGQKWLVELLDIWSKSDRDYFDPIAGLAFLINIFRDDSEVAAWLCAYQFKWFEVSDSVAQEHDSQVSIVKTRNKRVSHAVDFLKSLAALGENSIMAKSTRHFLGYPRLYDAVTLADMVLGLQDENLSPNIQKLTAEARKRLKASTAKTRKEGDYSILEIDTCKCKDCVVLHGFLKSKKETQYVWPLAQGRRYHIHRVIDDMGIGVSHQTQREGCPYKLVLKKLNKYFKNEARVKTMQSEKLAKIEAIYRLR